MKYSIYIITIFVTLSAFTQTRDSWTQLDISDGINEISISPDEKVWLMSSTGNIYYTSNFDSTWHYGKPIFGLKYGQGTVNTDMDLERISFFNKDTAIVTGGILKRKARQNGCYWTGDAGKTWKFVEYGTGSWIESVFVDKRGNAWMGGEEGEIYYSKDFGRHWEKLNSPFNSSSHVTSIFMVNKSKGISGTSENEMYTTSDNWKSCKKIETPYDQNTYVHMYDMLNYNIEKIAIWKNYIVVNQHFKNFYTEKNKIDWKPFPVAGYNFELDNVSKTLFIIEGNNKIYAFKSPTDFDLIADQTPPYIMRKIRAFNGTLYFFTVEDSVCKVNKNGLKSARLYTNDKKE